MGFMKPELPAVDAATFAALPRAERLQVLTRHWVEHGFGSPAAVYLLYVVKALSYAGGAALVISFTPGLGSVFHPHSWWSEPVVYEKLIVWTLLFEVVGLGCGSGPLTSRFMPPVGAVLYWLRPGTIRLPPWPSHVPLTSGDRRTPLDVVLYLAVLASGVFLLVGRHDAAATIPLIVSLGALGLRDKTIFLAARGEQYWLSLLIFFFPVHDELIGFKLVMLALWWGAATSKLNRHFPFVIATMMSNAPFIRSKAVKRRFYRDFPDDLTPSWLPRTLAHVGTATEFGVPFFLVFLGQGGFWTWAAVVYMIAFHLQILATVPMGVPLEWNVFFIFSLLFLFGAHGHDTLWDLHSPLLLVILAPSLVLIPVLGNLRPELVSFLPAMRYYAGNWATSVWLFRGTALDSLETHLVTACKLPTHQLEALYDDDTAMIMGQKVQSWRSMHSHGRAHNGLIDRVIGEDLDVQVMDGELVAGFALGWNFGEGHLHDDQLMDAIQSRCHFAPGDLRVICLESQPFGKDTQVYEVYDAALGLLERGHVRVSDMLTRQPWPTDGAAYPAYDVESLQPLSSAVVPGP